MSLRSKFIMLLILLNGLLLIFCFSFYINTNISNKIRDEIAIIDAVNKALYEEDLAVRGMFILPIAKQIVILEDAEKKLDKAISNLLQVTYLTDRSSLIDSSIKNIISERYDSLVSMPTMLDIADKILNTIDRSLNSTATFDIINDYAEEHRSEEIKIRVNIFSDLLFNIENNIVAALANFDAQYKIIEVERVKIERSLIIIFIAFFLSIAIISIVAGGLIARSIIKVTYDLNKANKETDAIFKNIHEGIFQLDGSFKIGTLCSKYFEDIFNTIDFRNMPFPEFLAKIGVPAKDIAITEDYLKLFFNDEINNALLAQVNPLDKIQIFLLDNNGEAVEKYLSFSFSVFTNADDTKEMLGAVKDVTEEVLYSEALKEEEEKNKDKMEQLFQVINVEPAIMEEFFEDSQNEIDHINALLKSNRSDYHAVLNEIYLAVHSVKGNAQLLGMKNIAALLHKIENQIKNLLERSDIKWENILDFTIQLGRIQEGLDDLKKRVKDILLFQTRLKDIEEKTGLFERTLNKVLISEGGKEGKILSLDYNKFNSKYIPKEHRKVIKDIFVQLARNAIWHGIEKPEERKKKGKDPQGTIYIALEKDNEGNITYSFKDDGNGIDVEKLASIAKQKGLIKEGANFDISEAIKLIFNPGFSTAEENSLGAGRGIGLPFIKTRVSAMKGKIKIKTQKGKYCEYIIILPTGVKEEIKA